MKIRNTDYCLGCTASKLFLIVLVPILYSWFIYPNYVVSKTFDLGFLSTLWISNVFIFGIEFIKEGNLHSKLGTYLSNFYFISLIFYVLVVDSRVSHPILLSFFFALPQISIYLYKIFFKQEFTNRKLKFTFRVLFIIGFYFALSGLSNNQMFMGSYIVLSGVIFMKLRSFSKYRVDETVKLDYNITSLGAWYSRFVDSDGRLIRLNGLNLYLKVFIVLSFTILFFTGLIGLTPTTVCSSMTNNSVLLAAAGSPLITMSNKSFCSNCGAGLKPNDRFCESCGVQVQGGGQSSSSNYNQTRQRQNREPVGGYSSGSGYQPYGGGYQRPYGSQRYGNRHSTSAPVVFGILVFFVVLILTSNFILALILGVVGYFGASWAESVDNPCLAFCIMDTCIDCICSATSAEMQRKGRF